MFKKVAIILAVMLITSILPVMAAGTVTLELKYDDYYTLDKSADIVSQTVNSEGERLGDTAVVEIVDDKIHAVGLGTATVTIDGLTYNVNVSKADLALIMIAGQSNAAGDSSDYTMAPDAEGEYKGKFYITNSMNATLPTSYVTLDAARYGAEHGGRMQTLTLAAFDKWSAAAASTLARKLVDLWDMKVWVVNTAVCGSKMERWVPGGNLNTSFINYSKAAKAEIASDGHYVLDEEKFGYLWLQGCSDGFGMTNLSMEEYMEDYTDMHNKFKTETEVNYGAIWQVRAGVYGDNPAEDFFMSGPRLAQYYMGNSSEFSDIHLLLDTDIWRFDENVKAYFENKYGTNEVFAGRFGYDMPETLSDIKPGLHYNQKGYNELGDEGAINLAKILGGNTEAPKKAELRDSKGNAFGEEIALRRNGEITAVPILTDIDYNSNADIKLKSEDESIAIADNTTYKIKGISGGTVKINVCYGDKVLATYNAIVNDKEFIPADYSTNFLVDFTADDAGEQIEAADASFGAYELTKNGLYTTNTALAYYKINVPNRTTGKYILETTLEIENMQGVQFGAAGETGLVQNILMTGKDGVGTLHCQNASGVAKIQDFDLSQELSLKMILDLDNDGFELYVNGTKATLPYTKLYKSKNIQTIQWVSYPDNKMYIKNVSLYEEPDVNKDFKVDFTAYNAENIAKGLGLNLTSATVDKNGIYTTNTSDTTYSFNVGNRTTGKYTVETTIKFDGNSNAQFGVKGDNGLVQNLLMGNKNGKGVLFCMNATSVVQVQEFDMSQELNLKMEIDLDNNSFALFVNGTEATLPYTNLYKSKNIKSLQWVSLANNKMYIKEVKMSKIVDSTEPDEPGEDPDGDNDAVDLGKDFVLDFTADDTETVMKELGISFGASQLTESGIYTTNTALANYKINVPNRTTGKYILETTLKIEDMQGVQFAAVGETGAVQNILMTAKDGVGTLHCQNANGVATIQNFDLSKDLNLKVLLDLDNDSFGLYVNGVKATLPYTKLYKSKNIQTIQWVSYANNKMYIKKVGLREMPDLGKDFSLDFTSPDAPEVIHGVGLNVGNATVDENGIQLITTRDTSHILNIPNRTTGKYVVETTVRFEGVPDAQFRVRGETSSTQNLLFGYDKNSGQGKLFTQNASGVVQVCPFEVSQDITLKMVLDLDNNGYELYFNGTKMNLAYAKLYRDDNIQQFDWFGRANNEMYIKSLKMYKVPDLNGDFELDFTTPQAESFVPGLGITPIGGTVTENGLYYEGGTGNNFYEFKIPARTTGKYSVEATLKVEKVVGVNANVFFGAISSNGKYVQRLSFGGKDGEPGALFATGASGFVKVGEFDISEDITVKMDIDLDNNSYVLYANGKPVTLAYSKLAGGVDLQSIQWMIGAKNKAYIKTIKVESMYQLPELSSDFELDFTSSDAGSLAQGLNISPAGGTVTENGLYYTTTANTFYELKVPARTTGKYSVEATLRVEKVTGVNANVQFGIPGSNGKYVQRISFGGKDGEPGALFATGASGFVKVGEFDISRDITVKMDIDLDNNSYVLYANGNPVTLGYPHTVGGTDIKSLQWMVGANNKLYIKKLKLTELVDLSGDFSFDFTSGKGTGVVNKAGINLGTSTVTSQGIAVSGTTPVTFEFPERTEGKYIFEADYNFVKGNDINAGFYNADSNIQTFFVDKNLAINTRGEDTVPLNSEVLIEQGKSFNVKILLDFDEGNFKVYHNDVVVPIKYAYLLGENMSKIKWVGYTDGLYYIEKIRLYKDNREYVDVTVRETEGGTIDIPSVKFFAGDKINLKAEPDEGYEFDMWSGIEDYLKPSVSYEIKGEENISASFVESSLKRKGDVNLNGKVDVMDAVEILKTAAGIKVLGNVGYYAAEVTGDKMVSVNDAVKILRYISRIAPSLDLTEEEKEAAKPKKYLTFSFDDGITQDARIMEILNKYGLTATFNINTGMFGLDSSAGVSGAVGVQVSHVRLTEQQVADGYYDGFEVAGHTVTHPALSNISDEEVIRQVQTDFDNIERITGQKAIGLAYPGGTQSVSEQNVKTIMETTSACYARTTTSTGEFTLPERFLWWHPTSHISSESSIETIMGYVQTVHETELEYGGQDMLIYIWGHGYEFDQYNTWDEFEELCAYIASCDDIICVTNGEFYEMFKNDIPR